MDASPASIYAKLHKSTTLPDSSIQPVFCNQVQNGVSQSCRCVYIANSSSGLTDVAVLCQIDLLVLETAEPSFNHDVICPVAFAIHALPDSVILYEVNIVLTGKLTALI